jgi:hypothetical protein
MMFVGPPYAPDSVHGPLVTDMATERVARVGGVSDQPALAYCLDDFRDSPGLRVDRMNFDDFCHARILG